MQQVVASHTTDIQRVNAALVAVGKNQSEITARSAASESEQGDVSVLKVISTVDRPWDTQTRTAPSSMIHELGKEILTLSEKYYSL